MRSWAWFYERTDCGYLLPAWRFGGFVEAQEEEAAIGHGTKLLHTRPGEKSGRVKAMELVRGVDNGRGRA